MTVQDFLDIITSKVKEPRKTELDFISIGVNEKAENVEINIRNRKATIYGVFRSALEQQDN